MYLKHHLSIAAAAAAASLPAASAEFNPAVGVGDGHAATTLSMPVGGTGSAPAPWDVDGGDPPAGLYAELPFVGPTWSATKYYNAEKGGLVSVAEGSVVTLEIEDDGRFDGNAGCNSYFGRLEAAPLSVTRASPRSAGSVEFSLAVDGPVGSTMRMCTEEATMAQEAAYLANFEGTINVNLSQDGSLLRLKAKGGSVVAEYTLFVPRLLDQTWTVAKYYSADKDALVDVLPGSVLTLTMAVDENLSGSAGCNNYFGAYDDLTRASFAMANPVDVTRMYCGAPGGLMDQERAYLRNFEGGRLGWRIADDDSLELREADSGAVVALYNAGSEKALDRMSASGGAAIKTTLSVVAVAAVIAFV